MATEVVHSVGSTGDYSTINAWEAAQQRDLVSADEIAVAELQAETFVEDVQVNGWTVDATRFIHIRAAAGAEYDHVAGTGAWLYFASNFPADFYHDVTITGIRHGTPTHERIAYLRNGAATHSHRCFITSKKLHLLNNGCTITASIVQQPAGFNDVLLQYFTLQNVTVIADNTYGQIARYSVCQNVLIYNAQSAPTYDNFYGCSGDYNAGSTSAAPGANSVHNITSAEFADYAGGDYHLASDSQLIGAGTDLSSVFTTDIDGDTITTWMIGADYYAAGGSTLTIQSDATLQWSSLSTVTTDATLQSAIVEAVQSDVNTAWRLLQSITRDNTLAFATLQALAADLGIDWSRLEQVAQSSDLRWSLNAALSTLVVDLDLRHALRQQVEAGLDVRWTLLNAVTRDVTLQSHIVQAVESNTQIAWNLLNYATADKALAFATLQAIAADMTAPWSITEIIQQSADLRWSLNSSLTTVSADLDLRHSLLAQVTGLLDARWDAIELVAADFTTPSAIANSVITSLELPSRVLQHAQTEFDLRWDSIALSTGSMTLNWTLGDEQLTPIDFIFIPREQRQFALRAEQRIYSAHRR